MDGPNPCPSLCQVSNWVSGILNVAYTGQCIFTILLSGQNFSSASLRTLGCTTRRVRCPQGPQWLRPCKLYIRVFLSLTRIVFFQTNSSGRWNINTRNEISTDLLNSAFFRPMHCTDLKRKMATESLKRRSNFASYNCIWIGHAKFLVGCWLTRAI